MTFFKNNFNSPLTSRRLKVKSAFKEIDLLRKVSYLIWTLSLLYFIIYATSASLRAAINQNASLSILHGGLGVIFLGGIFGFILLRLWRVFH